MKNLIYFVLMSLSLSASANPPSHFYSVVSYNCMMESGLQISYIRGRRDNRVEYLIRLPQYSEKLLWNDGGRFFESANVSEIMFTGHKPSAGPVFDPLESDFVLRIAGRIEVGEAQRYSVELFENRAFTKFKKVSTGECDIEVERIF